MIGILGNFYIGTRIFDVVLQLSRRNEKKMKEEYKKTGDPRCIAIWQSPSVKIINNKVESQDRNYIVVEDYIVYMDMIYHGSEDEKDLISFMMLDEVGLGKITFPFYENFLIQFYSMYG